MRTALPAEREAGWRERIATLAIFLALGMGIGTWAAAIPELGRSLGLDAARLSVVLLVIPLASVLATVVMGLLAPRFGSGPMTAIAAIATVAGFAMPGLARTYPQLLACAVAVGVGAGSIEVAVNGHASDIERRWKGAIMSSFHAAFSFGGLLGAGLGSVAVWAGAGVQGQLWGPLSLAAVLVLLALPALGPGARAPAGSPLANVTWPDRAMVALGVVATLSYLIEGAMADWSAVFTETVAGAPAWLAAAGYASFSVTMAAGRLLGDGVVRRLGPSRVLRLGGTMAALGLTLAVVVPAPWSSVIGFGLVGLGAANIVPIVFSAAGRLAASPAAGIAGVSSFGFAGFLAGPPLIGAVATAAGLRIAIGVLIFAAVAVPFAARRIGDAGGDQPSRRRSRT